MKYFVKSNFHDEIGVTLINVLHHNKGSFLKKLKEKTRKWPNGGNLKWQL